jgi:hypothetical protein
MPLWRPLGDEWEQLEITQPNWAGQLDNVICPSCVQMENELQICQAVEVKNINDFIVKVWH